MQNFEDKVVKVISKLTCDDCGEQATQDDYEFHEFISIEHRCGYGSLHGDGKQFSIDLCQKCFADMCGDSLSIIEPDNEKHASDLRIKARDILLANRIANREELTVALKRVEQLWDAQYHSAEGNDLHQLADLINDYEGKSWDSYFNEVDAVSDDFLAEREIIIKQKGLASGILPEIKVNKDIDDDDS